jgi:toxin ParE1/3/4
MNGARRRFHVRRKVVFAPEAEDDLLQIYDFIADRANPDRAYAYVERIRSYCLAFDEFPERGVRRDELRPGLRIVGFERRVTISFHITPTLVVIDRILYGGRDVEGLLADG